MEPLTDDQIEDQTDDQTDWQQREVDTARKLVNEGSNALRNGALPFASETLMEASAILDMVEDRTTEDVLKLRAQVANELGFLAQREDRTEEALGLHERAVDICDQLIDMGVDFRGNATATHINLAGLLAGKGDLAKAKKVGERAVEMVGELLEEKPDDDQARNLAFGAHQNLAVVHARSGDFRSADETTRDAIRAARELIAEGNLQLYAQAAQAAQQVSVLMYNGDEYDLALKWGHEAEELSERAYEAIGEQALPIYVTSQINLISYQEKQGAFADAEDALWKALDVVGNHPDILRRGQAFYENCRKQADNRLEAGNLPREEVEAGYEEVRERIEEIGGLPEIES